MHKSYSFHTQGKAAVSQISTFLYSQQGIVFLKTKMSIQRHLGEQSTVSSPSQLAHFTAGVAAKQTHLTGHRGSAFILSRSRFTEEDRHRLLSILINRCRSASTMFSRTTVSQKWRKQLHWIQNLLHKHLGIYLYL